jgi:peptidylprolyl isomerase
MKNALLLFLLAGSLAVQAQTTQKPTTSTAKSATAHPAATVPVVKVPPNIPKVVGPLSTAFTLRYQEIKVGTGPIGQPNKQWKVFYTGYRAADGVKFDSSDDHRDPLKGADGKPVMDANGQPKLGDPQPLAFPQGMGRLIPGFDHGVTGMHIGGKRRIFIPWQLAYGPRAMPDRPGHPGIPANSDLIFDVELVEVTDLPAPPGPQAPQARPGAQGNPGASAIPPPPQPRTGAQSNPSTTPPPSPQPKQ